MAVGRPQNLDCEQWVMSKAFQQKANSWWLRSCFGRVETRGRKTRWGRLQLDGGSQADGEEMES